MTKIKDTPKIKRPREKYLQKGPDALSKREKMGKKCHYVESLVMLLKRVL